MKPPDDTSQPKSPPEAVDEIRDATTGLPVLRTWRAVYTFVLSAFILWVTLLILLSRAFS